MLVSDAITLLKRFPQNGVLQVWAEEVMDWTPVKEFAVNSTQDPPEVYLHSEHTLPGPGEG